MRNLLSYFIKTHADPDYERFSGTLARHTMLPACSKDISMEPLTVMATSPFD